MSKVIEFVLGEIFFDLDDLTPPGWVLLLLALAFALGVGVVSYSQLYPQLNFAEINPSNRKVYAFLVIAPLIGAAIAPLCLGIPLLRRAGVNITKTDAECRDYLSNAQVDPAVEQYIVFEIASPPEGHELTLTHNLSLDKFAFAPNTQQKFVAYKRIRPTLSRLSMSCRSVREVARLAHTKCMSWKLAKTPLEIV